MEIRWRGEGKLYQGMKTHLEMAKHKLFDAQGLDLIDFKLFPGSNRDATPELVAEQITNAIAQIEAGHAEEVAQFDD